jgi:hypothetical protein
MVKAIRVIIPQNKIEKTLKLCNRIVAKNTADGAASVLNDVIDMVTFAGNVGIANTKRNDAAVKEASAQKKYEKATNNCGLGKGQHKDVKFTVVWYVRQIRDLLLIVHDGNEEALSEYGFNVVITTTGARKNIRVDIPNKAEDMVELGEAIVAQHTLLAGASPLTAALVDMAAFETLVTDTGTLLSEWEILRGEVESLNNQSAVLVGYAEGQTSTTPGTLYHEITKIRTRLLQKFTGEEKSLEEFGFDVQITEHSPGRKKGSSSLSIKGKVTDSDTGNPIANALVHLVEPDIFTLTDDNGNFEYEKIAAGNYNIQAHKTGYESDPVVIMVVAGQVTNVDLELAPETATGSISGTVTKTGLPAEAVITILNVAGSTSTDPSGAFNRDGLSAGAHSVRATLIDNPSEFMDQPANVPAGGNVVVNFAFP